MSDYIHDKAMSFDHSVEKLLPTMDISPQVILLTAFKHILRHLSFMLAYLVPYKPKYRIRYQFIISGAHICHKELKRNAKLM